MDATQLKVAKLNASLERHKAYMVLWQTRILSGDYKRSQMKKYNPETKEWDDPLTDEEKLRDAIQCLESHCKFATECVDNILEINSLTFPRASDNL